MASLIVYLVLFGSAIAAVFGFVYVHDEKIKEDEAALWKPKLEAAQKQYEELSTLSQEQSTKLGELRTASEEAMARAKTAEAKAIQDQAKQAEKLAKLNAILAAPPERDRTKDCNAAEALTDDFFAERLRSDRP